MGLITKTAESYYNQSQSFIGNGTLTEFTLTDTFFPTIPTAKSQIKVTIDGKEIGVGNYNYPKVGTTSTIQFTANTDNTDVLESDGRVKNLLKVIVSESVPKEKFGNYRYISLNDLVNNYIVAFVGDGKIISNVKKSEVLFHAKRGIQEFSYDISRVEKIQEIEISPSLSIPMPQDYVNYVRISAVDESGIEHIIYPASLTSRPSESPLQDNDYDYVFGGDGALLSGTPLTGQRFDEFDVSKLISNNKDSSVTYDADRDSETVIMPGGRYGLDPEYSQENGLFVIDELNGKISFSSNMSGRIITLKYISDGLGTDDEMQVHKFAEDAMYKYITHAIASTMLTTPEYIINRFRKEKRAAMRNAKLRLSNIKIGELAQIMRGKSKQIKH
jgi:hypothetical protein|tara:strand:+ start:317 stop:1477 length:1161 start_codon:yes stop_codon:yes gene_type:complete